MNKTKEPKKHLLKRFVSYYKPYKGLFILDMIASFIMSGIGMLYPIVTRKIFSELVPEEDINQIIVWGLVLIGVYILRFGLKFFIDYYGHSMGVRMQADMRMELFKKLEDLPFSYYDEHETGQIMSRMTVDLNYVSELAHHGPENIFITGTTLICALAYLLTINLWLSLLIFAAAPILFGISLATRQIQLNAFTQTKADMAKINGSLESSVSGIRVTKSFYNKDKEMEKFDASNKKYVKSRKYAYKAMGIYHASTTLIINLFNVLCIVGGGIIAIKSDIFGVEDYLAFAVSVGLFSSPMQTLVAFVEQYQDGSSGFRRFCEIMDTPSEIDNTDGINVDRFEGNIEFDNIYFDYDTKDNIINGLSLSIKKGETVALVGESGGGKTTICHLLPRFYRLRSGSIKIDGLDINDLSLKSLRTNIGIVQQDVFLFAGTIRENVIYGKLDATEEEVIDALKKANIYDFVETLPDGLDTMVGERGVKLSGGQKQRISIARIFLKNPSILILDEATSALDNATEMAIQESLEVLARGKTSIVVAHRLSTVKNADRIVVIENGQITEQGTHDELLTLDGRYAKLYKQQFKNITFK